MQPHWVWILLDNILNSWQGVFLLIIWRHFCFLVQGTVDLFCNEKSGLLRGKRGGFSRGEKFTSFFFTISVHLKFGLIRGERGTTAYIDHQEVYLYVTVYNITSKILQYGCFESCQFRQCSIFFVSWRLKGLADDLRCLRYYCDNVSIS
jgi:hypothetical protein